MHWAGSLQAPGPRSPHHLHVSSTPAGPMIRQSNWRAHCPSWHARWARCCPQSQGHPPHSISLARTPACRNLSSTRERGRAACPAGGSVTSISMKSEGRPAASCSTSCTVHPSPPALTASRCLVTGCGCDASTSSTPPCQFCFSSTAQRLLRLKTLICMHALLEEKHTPACMHSAHKPRRPACMQARMHAHTCSHAHRTLLTNPRRSCTAATASRCPS